MAHFALQKASKQTPKLQHRQDSSERTRWPEVQQGSKAMVSVDLVMFSASLIRVS